MAKVTVKSAKKRAWKVFSEFIRKRDMDKDGYCTCYTCGKRSRWDDGMQAGHGMSGRGNPILFHEELVKAQCVRCNIFLDGNYDIYHAKLIKEYGMEQFDEWIRLKNSHLRFTVDDLEEMIVNYRKRTEKL